MKNVTLLDRLRYRFDNSMSRGPASLIIWLALITLVLVLGTSLFVLLMGSDPDKDKVEMEDEIRAQVRHAGHTRIVCRTGSPLDPTDLEIVNPHGARAIIILPPESGDRDTYAIKSMLALTNNPERKAEPYHIIATIHEPENLDIARMVGRDEVELVLVSELISRVTVQTCRQAGLSVVYLELLNFEGDEIYFKAETALTGKT